MKPTRESTGDARDAVLGRLAVALSGGRATGTAAKTLAVESN